MPMADVDRIEYGLYMQIIRERAERRARKKASAPSGDGKRKGNGKADKVVYLHRGTIDEVW